MSSHHFVKEGQEPALFIIDPISFNHIQLLLEWAPLVVVADTALDAVLLWGIKVDAVLVMVTRLEEITEKISIQNPVQIITYENNGDIIKTGLEFLIADRQHTVTLISNGSRDVFDLLQNFPDTLKIALLDETTKWSFIAGKHFKKWIAGGSVLAIRSTKELQKFSTQGLVEASSGYFKASHDSLVSIDASHPFWIGESL